MPLFTEAIARGLEARSSRFSGLKSAMPWLVDFFGGGPTASGKNVNVSTALTLTAVYDCIRLIAWTMASLPLITYKSLEPRGKERDKRYYLYKLLHDSPNPLQTSFECISLVSVHQNLWGAGILEIEFDANGNPVALWPLPPWCVTPKKLPGKRDIVYEVSVENRRINLMPYQVLCFRALGTDMFGPWQSPIDLHRETIGAAIAVKEFGARTFGQGVNPAGIIESTVDYGEDEEKSLEKMLSKYQGLGNEHRVMLLSNGLKFNRIGLPPKDSQFLESRQFDIAEIARIYNVPLHKLKEHSKSTSFGAGIEEMNIDFVASTMRPYFVQWEQEFKRKLIFDDVHFVEFLVDGLLRGRLKDRYEAYKIAVINSWMCPDDVREKENMNPIPGGIGAVYLMQTNMQSLEFARERKADTQNGNATAGDDDPEDDTAAEDKNDPANKPATTTGEDEDGEDEET